MSTGAPVAEERRGRHEAEPDPLSDWHPQEIGGRLTGGNVRWSLLLVFVLTLAGATGIGYWLYQRPAAVEQASLTDVNNHALALQSSLQVLEDFNESLLLAEQATETSALYVLEGEARALFGSSGALDRSQTELRSAALQASSSTLDGIRLAADAHSYRLAVLPILSIPPLETDPELIALDEAARSFGSWQLSFDQVRTVLPDEVLADVTQQLDILSGDLSSIMGRYVDALREDDEDGANAALLELSTRLSRMESTMDEAIVDIQERVSLRVAAARASLDRLLGN